MKNRYKGMALMVLLFTALHGSMEAAAETVEGGSLFRIESTAYCYGEITASGQQVREGICAGKKEWIGLTCILYADDGGKPGDYIGIFEILDTGGDERIRDGRCIDLYMENKSDCIEWGRRNVWIQLVDARG